MFTQMADLDVILSEVRDLYVGRLMDPSHAARAQDDHCPDFRNPSSSV